MASNRHLTKTCTDCGGLFALPLHGLGPRCWDYGLGGLPIDSLGNFTCLECAAESDTTGSVARDGSAWDGVVAVDTDGGVTSTDPVVAARRAREREIGGPMADTIAFNEEVEAARLEEQREARREAREAREKAARIAKGVHVCPKFSAAVSALIEKWSQYGHFFVTTNGTRGLGCCCYVWVTGAGFDRRGNPTNVKSCFCAQQLTFVEVDGQRFDDELKALPGYASHYVNLD